MGQRLNILFLEEPDGDVQLVLDELKRRGFIPVYEKAETLEAMKIALERQAWDVDVILSDYSMPNFSALSALNLLKEKGLDIPFIIISSTTGEETAVAAIKAGANDFLLKENLIRLAPAIEREMKEAGTRRKKMYSGTQINYLAYYDLLTDLPNRLMLHDSIETAISKTKDENGSFALLFMDLDRFREINNTLGHDNGDLILQQVGLRLRKVAEKTDTVSRFGGDEFVVLLPDRDMEGATEVASKIIKIFEGAFSYGEFFLHINISIGIALFPGHAEDTHNLIRVAEIAMYVAKKSESGWVIYSSQYDQHSPARLTLIGELRNAIESGQLFLVYQPKVDLKTNRIIGVEALVRWQHPRLGVVPPDQFISAAEKTGMIRQLTLWVLGEVLKQSRSWHQEGIEITISVNLSVRNLQAPRLTEQISGLLSTWGVAPERLRFEITESLIMFDPDRALEVLSALHREGIRFSIDDFGTGYSSLGYLKRLPVDEIKIDKSFVINMVEDENNAKIVRSVIDLAHNLGLQVAAEGVENKEVMDRLTSLECDSAQGYFIGRPSPVEGLTRALINTPPQNRYTYS
ncbi:MAG: GGDEF domain-containing response regulator [Nitrospirota bacterium]